MRRSNLVHALWDGAVRPSEEDVARAFHSLFVRFIPVQTTLLTIDSEYNQPQAMVESAFLQPELTVGDVVSEELGIDVSYGSLIVIRRREGLDDLSHAVGHVVGEVLIAMSEGGNVPLEREDEVVFEMAASCANYAASCATDIPNFDGRSFCSGLSTVLCRRWSIPLGKNSLFTHGDVSALPRHLRAHIERSNVLPHMFAGDCMTFESWSRMIGARYTTVPWQRSEGVHGDLRIN